MIRLRRVGRNSGGPGAGQEPSPAPDDRVGVAPSPLPTRLPADAIERMERRAAWLYKRAMRKPVGSNGRHEDLVHAAELAAKVEAARDAAARIDAAVASMKRRWSPWARRRDHRAAVEAVRAAASSGAVGFALDSDGHIVQVKLGKGTPR